MTTPDFINATFELLGGLFILNHCRVLFKDKILKGVSIVSTTFFTTWGAWNLFYYPHLGQWASFYGGLAIFSANILWIGLALWYRTRSARELKKVFGNVDIVPMPKGFKFHNGCTEPCDMAVGPCCCGATHTLYDFPPTVRIAIDSCPECDRSPCRCSLRSQ